MLNRFNDYAAETQIRLVRARGIVSTYGRERKRNHFTPNEWEVVPLDEVDAVDTWNGLGEHPIDGLVRPMYGFYRGCNGVILGISEDGSAAWVHLDNNDGTHLINDYVTVATSDCVFADPALVEANRTTERAKELYDEFTHVFFCKEVWDELDVDQQAYWKHQARKGVK